MKSKIIFIILLLCISNFFIFPSEQNDIEFNKHTNDVSSDLFIMSKISNHTTEIFVGASLLGMIAVPPIPAVALFLTPLLWGINIGFGVIPLIFEAPLIVVGSALLGYGAFSFNKKYEKIPNEIRQIILKSKCQNYKILGIVTGILSGIFCSSLIPGVVLALWGYNTNDALINPQYNASMQFSQRITTSNICVTGVSVAIISGIGLGICCPLMIASLAISAWCKGEFAKLSHDISLTHDDKKDYTEGYGVSVGMRVRI